MAKVVRWLAGMSVGLCGLLWVGMAAGAAGLSGPAGPAVANPADDLAIPQIGQVAYTAGFRGDSLAMAISVALAESGGNPAATDYDSNGTVDRGIWQINSVHTQISAACDFDPPCAAVAAYQVSDSGRDWSPWVTYDHGAEIPFLPEAVAWVHSQGSRA